MNSERKARDLFTCMLRQRRSGVNFDLREHRGTWEVLGASFEREFHAQIVKEEYADVRKDAMTVYFYYNTNDDQFVDFDDGKTDISCLADHDNKRLVVSLDVNTSTLEQARWLVRWLLGEIGNEEPPDQPPITSPKDNASDSLLKRRKKDER